MLVFRGNERAGRVNSMQRREVLSVANDLIIEAK